MDEPCVEIIEFFSASDIVRSHNSLEHLRAIRLPRHADVIAEVLQQLGIDQSMSSG
jgi:hypothetical protein